jgi:hypothetical protein
MTLFLRPSSPASYLENLQRKNPFTGQDRIGQLYACSAQSLPAALTHLVERRAIVLGAVGQTRPDAYTVHLRDGSAIVFTTGMLDFIYAVTRSLVGIVVGHGNAGVEYQQALGLGGVADLVARLFNQWKGQRRWYNRSKQINYPRFRLNEHAHGLAETVAKNAEAYILCHELAHAMTAHQGGDDTEEHADALGLRYFMSAAVKNNQRRIPVASMMLVVRIFASLERVGVHISSEYPPASERTENLRRALRELTESDLDVDEMLTIAVALQELMDDVDDVIAGVARRTHVDIYRSYVGLLSRLEEVVRGRITEAEFIRGVEEIARNLCMDRMRKVANHLANSYPLYPFGNPQPSRRELMGERLREMYPQLPLDLRTLFHN